MKRVFALDILRGITIIGMILVNTPGSWTYTYSPLLHAPAWMHCGGFSISFLLVYHGAIHEPQYVKICQFEL